MTLHVTEAAVRQVVPWYAVAYAWLRAHWQLPVLLLVLVVGYLLASATGSNGLVLAAWRKIFENQRKVDDRVEKIRKDRDAQVHAIEAEHAETLNALQTEQAIEYIKIRKNGPKAVAKWLTDFDNSLQ